MRYDELRFSALLPGRSMLLSYSVQDPGVADLYQIAHRRWLPDAKQNLHPALQPRSALHKLNRPQSTQIDRYSVHCPETFFVQLKNCQKRPQLPSDFSFAAANIEEAGENLVTFKNIFMTGFILQFISTTIMVLYPENTALKNMFLAGTISGGLIQIISLNKAGMAGVYLDEAAYELEKLDQ